jgi:hypothetical protein
MPYRNPANNIKDMQIKDKNSLLLTALKYLSNSRMTKNKIIPKNERYILTTKIPPFDYLFSFRIFSYNFPAVYVVFLACIATWHNSQKISRKTAYNFL